LEGESGARVSSLLRPVSARGAVTDDGAPSDDFLAPQRLAVLVVVAAFAALYVFAQRRRLKPANQTTTPQRRGHRSRTGARRRDETTPRVIQGMSLPAAGFRISMKRPNILLAVMFLLVSGGCTLTDRGGSAGDAQTIPEPPAIETAEGTVVLANVAYNPVRITVPAGREVTWKWGDNGLVHTVTADDGSFDSGRRTDGEFTRAFEQPGEYRYHCEVHARMNGTIVVAPS
jgi:plastocyanin